jgi:tetratricopeptide (TPR) repeat protein
VCPLIIFLAAALQAGVARAGLPPVEDVMSAGQCWAEAGRSWQLQIKACSEIIDPRFRATPEARAQAYFNRGWAHMYLCHTDAAIRDFGQAMHLFPGVASFHRGQAEAYKRKGNYALAERQLLTALTQDPQSHGLLADLAEVHLFQHRPQAALKNLEAAVALAPDVARFQARLADVFLVTGRAAAAVDAYSLAISLEGSDDRPFLGRARAHLALGELGEARSDVLQALKQSSAAPCARAVLARIDVATVGLGAVRTSYERALGNTCLDQAIRRELDAVMCNRPTDPVTVHSIHPRGVRARRRP